MNSIVLLYTEITPCLTQNILSRFFFPSPTPFEMKNPTSSWLAWDSTFVCHSTLLVPVLNWAGQWRWHERSSWRLSDHDVGTHPHPWIHVLSFLSLSWFITSQGNYFIHEFGLWGVEHLQGWGMETSKSIQN